VISAFSLFSVEKNFISPEYKQPSLSLFINRRVFAMVNIINEKQLTKICLELIREAPRILRERDLSNSKIDEKNMLLIALYCNLRQRLGMQPKGIPVYPDNQILEWAYRGELRRLFEFECEMRPRFDYETVIDEFLKEGLRRRGN
jgi:hypothetical protein